MAFTPNQEHAYVPPAPTSKAKQQQPVFEEAKAKALAYLETSIEQAQGYFVAKDRASTSNPIDGKTGFFSAPNWTISNKKSYLNGKPAKITTYAKTTGGGKVEGFFDGGSTTFASNEEGLIGHLQAMHSHISNCVKGDATANLLVKEAVSAKNKSRAAGNEGTYDSATDLMIYPN
jgi:hypothetical protein